MTGRTTVNALTEHESLPASAWVVRWSAHIPPTARTLDYAAGRGRNIAPLLARGARVTAVDRDPLALQALDPSVEAIQADLEVGPWPFGDRRFDVVVCCNYLFRPRMALMAGLLEPGGMLVHETFGVGNARYGRPASPGFLLRPGELFASCERAGLVVLGYESGYVNAPKPAIVQRVCAVRPPCDPERYPLVG